MPSKVTILVLVVDDEPSDIDAMQSALEGTGKFRVITASDYHQAVHVFKSQSEPVELALLDVALPGKNGVELAKRLLTLRPSLRVLFVSGHVGASVIRFYGINAADEHFLQKPFESDSLLRKVEHALASNEPLQFILSAASSGASDDEPLQVPDDPSGS